MSTLDPNDPLVGATLGGRYHLARIVADGGMGRVYEATDAGAGNRRVAVKVLHKDVAEDPVNIERFKREADTSKALPHPHITEVYDFAQEMSAPGRSEPIWYLVMEYLDGRELRAVLEKEPKQPLLRLLRIMAQSALALDFAHAQGVVHRDLKPDNIFLVREPDGEDRVKLLDFGSVKFTKGQDRGQKLTVMGTTIGSPHYMSPEQAKGSADLDHRADVWAMGVILYEGAVGKVPFHASNAPQILFKILGEEVNPPSFDDPALPEALDDVIAKALAKKTADRYSSVGEFADGLGRALRVPGNHKEWANMTQAELSASSGKRPQSIAPMAIGPAPQLVQAQQPANPASSQYQQPQYQQPQYQQQASSNMGGDSVPMSLPVSKFPTGLLLGGVALLVLAAVVAAVALR